jgi:hypothetical protein
MQNCCRENEQQGKCCFSKSQPEDSQRLDKKTKDNVRVKRTRWGPTLWRSRRSEEFLNLKVLANEKRGGLKVVAFDNSSFKLFTLKSSRESVQAPSCKRLKTTQQTPFLPFEINN